MNFHKLSLKIYIYIIIPKNKIGRSSTIHKFRWRKMYFKDDRRENYAKAYLLLYYYDLRKYWGSQQKWDGGPTGWLLGQRRKRWASVSQRWANVSCLLGLSPSPSNHIIVGRGWCFHGNIDNNRHWGLTCSEILLLHVQINRKFSSYSL